MCRIFTHNSQQLKYYIPALLWGLTILTLSIVSGVRLPRLAESIIGTDKLAHAAAYCVFCTLLLYGFRRNEMPFRRAALLAVCIGSGYGLLMECLQYQFFPHRYFEVWDIVANIIGSLLSVLVSYFFIK